MSRSWSRIHPCLVLLYNPRVVHSATDCTRYGYYTLLLTDPVRVLKYSVRDAQANLWDFYMMHKDTGFSRDAQYMDTFFHVMHTQDTGFNHAVAFYGFSIKAYS